MSEVADLLELMQAMPVWNTVQATVVHRVDASQAAAQGDGGGASNAVSYGGPVG